jgi:hypothetical protein
MSATFPSEDNRLAESQRTQAKISLNLRRNLKQDHTRLLDGCAAAFDYQKCKDQYWNPEEFSLLWGTPLWDEASPSQRILLNQLYWVAYYSQIISAEIATIFFNQTCAAGLFQLEDFRQVCDMLDLESAQERAHINAFKTISEQVEKALFGERVFTYPMRGPYAETMIFPDSNWLKRKWKALQLQTFGLLSSSNAFLACQYFTVRGIRTLNGKMVQQKLSSFFQKHPDKDHLPLPSQVSYYHFMDESFHFNSSTILAHDVIDCLPPPTAYEAFLANLGIRGCQKDHQHFSAAIAGLFWYEPAIYSTLRRVLRSSLFGMDEEEAEAMLQACFTEENEGIHRSYQIHQEAVASYQKYVEKLDYVWGSNKEMSLMATTTLPGYLEQQRQQFRS